jgi:hypothetical protein
VHRANIQASKVLSTFPLELVVSGNDQALIWYLRMDVCLFLAHCDVEFLV